MTRRSLTRGKPRGFGNNGLMRRIWACESRNGLGIGYLRPPQNHTTPSRVKGPEPVDPAGEEAMQRRSILKAAASLGLLAVPSLAKASRPTTLRFVPVAGLVILDPVAAT